MMGRTTVKINDKQAGRNIFIRNQKQDRWEEY